MPIMTIDRLLTTKTACADYIGWIGSDFVEQGERAADAMIKATGDKGEVAILLGASGVNVTVDRTKGFKDQLAAKSSKLEGRRRADRRLHPGEGPDGHRAADLGQPGHHRDLRRERRDGARRGRGAARRPARSRATSRSSRSTARKGAVQGIIDGWIAGVIESNPRFGPLAFQALEDFYSGKGVAEKTIISDKEYTTDNAAGRAGQRLLTRSVREPAAGTAPPSSAAVAIDDRRDRAVARPSRSSASGSPASSRSTRCRSTCSPARCTHWSARTAPASRR